VLYAVTVYSWNIHYRVWLVHMFLCRAEWEREVSEGRSGAACV